MKSWRHYPYLIIALIAIVILLVVVVAYGPLRHRLANNLPGTVVGNNPAHVPKSKLPLCDFDGSRFTNEPCYSPPGSLYD